MFYTINKDNIIKNECNVISNILNTTKREKYKISHYSPILQGCINTSSGRENFIYVHNLLYRRSSSTVVIGKLTSKLKQK